MDKASRLGLNGRTKHAPRERVHHARPEPHRRLRRRHDRLAAAPAPAPGTAIRPDRNRRLRGRAAARVRGGRAARGHRQYRHGRDHQRARRGRRRPHHRPARRHGRAADRGGDGQGLRFEERGGHARLRARRPHGDAAGRRALPGRDAQLLGPGRADLPAGRRRRRRCQGHGGRGYHGPLRHHAGLRHPQLAQRRAGAVRDQSGRDHGLGGHVHHQDRGPGRAWREASRDRRSAGRRRGHRAGDPDHRQPQPLRDAGPRGVGDAASIRTSARCSSAA